MTHTTATWRCDDSGLSGERSSLFRQYQSIKPTFSSQEFTKEKSHDRDRDYGAPDLRSAR
jgi:hypothetical protein